MYARMEYKFWGALVIITGIVIMFHVIRNNKSISAILYGSCLLYSIILIGFGITTILLKGYDYVCAILFGVSYLVFTYRNRHIYSPGLMRFNDLLKGYTVGLISIMYGLIRWFGD